MKIGQIVKISVVVGNSPYKYKGKIISIDDSFIKIQDKIEGIVSISKNKIATVVEVSNEWNYNITS